MRKIEDVLRLHAQGMSTRRIALATGVGKTTVIEYLRRAAVAGLSWPLPEGLDEEALERRVFPPPPPSQDRQFAAADWAMVHRELRRGQGSALRRRGRRRPRVFGHRAGRL